MHVRLTESRQNEDVLEYEIARKKRKKPDYYKHLADTLDYQTIKRLTQLAIAADNLDAVMGLLKANVYAATDILDTEDGVRFFSEKVKDQGDFMPEVYFFIRRPISPKYKSIFRRLARQSILKLSLKITSKGIRGKFKKSVPYYQIGMPEFSLDETIQHNPLKIHEKSINYKDIYGIVRKRQKRKVVLILDTSGSMYGRLLLNAALTTSVLAYNMEKEDYAIVLFNSTAMTLKKINQKRTTLKIIDDILDSEAVGFTDIHLGLEKGLGELNKTREARKSRFGILISDGIFNRGKNPIEVAKLFPKLHVIGMPAENDAAQGIRTCREIAEAGRGKFYAVTDYKEIPRALMELLTHD